MKHPEQVAAYTAEIQKLEQLGYAIKMELSAEAWSTKSWNITYHMAQCNGKNGVVFNFSFHYQGQNLNNSFSLDQC